MNQQKNGEKAANITQDKSTVGELCLVKIWAAIGVHQVLSYEGTSPKSQIKTFQDPTTGKLVLITVQNKFELISKVQHQILVQTHLESRHWTA